MAKAVEEIEREIRALSGEEKTELLRFIHIVAIAHGSREPEY